MAQYNGIRELAGDCVRAHVSPIECVHGVHGDLSGIHLGL